MHFETILSNRYTFEFVNGIKDLSLKEDEVMVSCDVCSLFPSIPVNIASNELEKHLNKCEIETEERSLYMKVAELCLKQSFFQFRENIYQVEFGINMGNPLSPLIAECLMASFEIGLRESGQLLNVWHGCVFIKRTLNASIILYIDIHQNVRRRRRRST